MSSSRITGYALLLCALCALLPARAGAQKATTKEEHPFVLGRVDELQSKVLGEKRLLNVYLPDGYKNDTATYPVIFLLDGSADEDFVHIVGLVQFLNMIGAMPKTIVVGIANVDRKRDFTFPTTIDSDKVAYPTTGGSAKFIRFAEEELVPYITKTYRTGSRTLIGQSLGGLVATEILLRKPALFNNYVIVSPSLWWDGESLLKQAPSLLRALPETPMKICVATGEEDKEMVAEGKSLVSLLQQQGRKQLSVNFMYLPEENHLTILHNCIYKALTLMNKK